MAVLFIGSFVAVSFIDKSYVEKQVSDAIKREFKINGELSPSISLSPSVKITGATLSNAEWGSKKQMAEIGEVEVSLSAIALLFGDIQINSIKLKDAVVILEKGEKWNFDFADQPTEEKADSEVKPVNVGIDNIEIYNLALTVNTGKPVLYNFEELSLAQGDEMSELNLKMLLDGKPINLKSKINPISDISSTRKVVVKNLDVSAFGYAANGNFNIDLTKTKPYVSGNINVAAVDLAKNAATAEKETAGYSKDPLPFDVFNAFDGDIKVNVASVKINDQVQLSKISIPTKTASGTMTAKGATANFADSKLNLDLTVSQKASSVDLKAEGMKVGKILLGDDFTGGNTNLYASLTGKGNSIYSLVNSLSGSTKLHLKDAVYSGSVKDGALQSLFKMLAGGASSSKTQIDCVISNIDWKNGVGEHSALAVTTDYAVVSGKGSITLPTQKVSLVLNPTAKNIGLTDLIVPPIAVKGQFDNVSVYPDPQGTAVSAIKTAAGIATGIGILAKAGELFADKTGISEAVGIAETNPCEAK